MTEYVMDADFGPSALSRSVQGLLGKGIDRIDGVAKVTGAALYAAEHVPQGKMAYGYAITATVAVGAVRSIDTKAAEAMPGVLAVITDDPRLPSESHIIRATQHPRNDGTLESYGQIIGLVVADSF